MSTFAPTIAVPYTTFGSSTEEAVAKKVPQSKIDFIEVDDIKDLPFETNYATGSLSFLTALGVTPSSIETKNLAVIATLSVFIGTILNIWISNIIFLAIFVLLALCTFVISIFTENKPFRVKIGGLLGDFFAVGVIATISQYLFNSFTLPIINTPIPILSGFLWLMIINYLVVDCKRLYPISSLAKSNLLTAFLLSAQDGFDEFKNKFWARMEDDVTGKKRVN